MRSDQSSLRGCGGGAGSDEGAGGEGAGGGVGGGGGGGYLSREDGLIARGTFRGKHPVEERNGTTRIRREPLETNICSSEADSTTSVAVLKPRLCLFVW